MADLPVWPMPHWARLFPDHHNQRGRLTARSKREELTKKIFNSEGGVPSTVKTMILTVLAMLALAVVAGLAILYSGAVSIAASEPHFSFTKWVLETGMERSLERHSSGLKAPAAYTEDQIQHGFKHFDKMCVQCHTAPGMKPSEISQGMRPKPPELHKVVRELKDAETFWLIRHGIKFTGMPSFGKTHSNDQIWAITGFVKLLPDMRHQEYARWKKISDQERDGHH